MPGEPDQRLAEALANVRSLETIRFDRFGACPQPVPEERNRTGVGVADLRGDRVREVSVVLPEAVVGLLNRPLPGRPLFRELSRRAFGLLAEKIAQPVETLYEQGRRSRYRGGHDESWDEMPAGNHELGRRPENYPLELIDLLGAPAQAVVAVTEIDAPPVGGATLEARVDLRTIEPSLAPVHADHVRAATDATARLRVTIDASGRASRLACTDALHGQSTGDYWRVLEIAPFSGSFDNADLFSLWHEVASGKAG